MRKKELKAQLEYSENSRAQYYVEMNELRRENDKIKAENLKITNEKRNFEFALKLAKGLGDKFIYVNNIQMNMEQGGYLTANVELTGDYKALYDFCMTLKEGA